MKNSLKLFRYIKEYKMQSILAPTFKMSEAVLELFVPLVMAAMIDVGIESGDTGYIYSRCMILIALAAAGVVLAVVAQYFSAVSASGFAKNLREALMQKISGLSFFGLDKIGTSTLITRMTSDINQLQTGVNLTLRLLLRSPFIVFGSLVMSFFIDVKLALVMCVIIPVLVLVIWLIMRKNIKGYKKIQGKVDELLLKTRQAVGGVRVIRAFAKEDDLCGEFASENGSLYERQIKVGRLAGLLNPLTLVIVDLGVCAILISGSQRVWAGYVTQGEIVALVNYMAAILVELIKYADLIVNISKSLASADRVCEVLDHEDRQRVYGEGLSFEFGTGEIIGVIGATGSGKSSLAAMIGGFYPTHDNAIRIDGMDVGKWRESKSLGFVFQKPTIFSGTVEDNIKIAKEDATKEEMDEALRLACAYDFVYEKGGLSAKVEQNGVNFSGGQKARIAIARALVGMPELLILDDAFSALDNATAKLVYEGIFSRARERNMTVVDISQRMASILSCDRIAVLNGGKIAGFGSHRELYISLKEYRDICDSQEVQYEG